MWLAVSIKRDRPIEPVDDCEMHWSFVCLCFWWRCEITGAVEEVAARNPMSGALLTKDNRVKDVSGQILDRHHAAPLLIQSVQLHPYGESFLLEWKSQGSGG